MNITEQATQNLLEDIRVANVICCTFVIRAPLVDVPFYKKACDDPRIKEVAEFRRLTIIVVNSNDPTLCLNAQELVWLPSQQNKKQDPGLTHEDAGHV